uniref:HDC06754 n=1 Tax=Drosophila melanogaster TaxID=7227 RepID=Q6IGB3_DROME|nr:TPA_inf: HDC06754 [Drosophila melanogaster]
MPLRLLPLLLILRLLLVESFFAASFLEIFSSPIVPSPQSVWPQLRNEGEPVVFGGVRDTLMHAPPSQLIAMKFVGHKMDTGQA